MSDSLTLSPEEIRVQFADLKTRRDVATLLDITDYQLRYYLYILGVDKCYTTFQVAKKSSGYRVIMAPHNALGIIQRKLNQVLSAIYQPKAPVHGFVSNKSVVTNAQMHLKKRFILNLDLENFFPSINFGRVRGLFKSVPYNCTDEVATILAQICCVNNILPQGAPTSPTVSNMICARMDSQLRLLAQKYKCTYTRYADDLTFSTSLSQFPHSLAHYANKSGQLILGDELQQIIENNGFKINYEKVRLKAKHQRQEVTGIIVNKKLNVNRRYVRQIRAMLHAWKKYGLEEAQKTYEQKSYRNFRESAKSRPDFRRVVKGKIEYLGMVRGKDDPLYLSFCAQLKVLCPELVKDSLFVQVKPSVTIPSPVIWTEGKTDWKHLKAALRELQKLGNFTNLNLRFKEDLDESRQGSSELLSLCNQLRKVPQNDAMIAIFDRDEPKIIGQVHDDKNGYKHWGNAVYSFALPIPSHRSKNPEICIELFYYDEELKTFDSNGRRLFLSNEFSERGRHLRQRQVMTILRNKLGRDKLSILDSDVFDEDEKNIALSKDDFAENILTEQENFRSFNFEAFHQIFATLEAIMADYTKLDLKSSNII